MHRDPIYNFEYLHDGPVLLSCNWSGGEKTPTDSNTAIFASGLIAYVFVGVSPSLNLCSVI